jgi:hypothetical protein
VSVPPVIHCRADEADAAFKAHQALLKAEREAPLLSTMPSFTMARQDAYERFANAFARL